MTHRVLKRIEFCYGHRIPGHAGGCAHLHGHTAGVDIECTGALDELGMVVDFAEIKRVVEGWIRENWDHQMVLRRDDPLVAILRAQGEPVYALEVSPTAENMAQHVFGIARAAGLPVTRVRFRESATSIAVYEEA